MVACLNRAWADHEPELRGWARHRLGDPVDVDDLLQDVYLKALGQGERFCAVRQSRAWLFEVARNALADRLRVSQEQVELPEDLASPIEETDAVDGLTACLPRVLSEMDPEDREAIELCDLQGMSQVEYALKKGLSHSGAKSRIQRARIRLKEQMTQVCQVKVDAVGHVIDFIPRK